MAKRIWERYDPTYHLKYMLTVGLIFALVFSIALYPYLSQRFIVWQVAFGFFIPTVLSWFGLSALIEENKLSKTTVDRRLSTDTTAPPIFDLSVPTANYYYPEINTNVMPIFSVNAIFNTTTCIIGFCYSIGFALATMNITMSVVMIAAIAFGISWLLAAGINIINLLKVIKTKGESSAYTINMKYRVDSFEKMLDNQSFVYCHNLNKDDPREDSLQKIAVLSLHITRSLNNLNEDYPREDLLQKIAFLSLHITRSLNILIAKGYADATVMASEIKTVEYVMNSFVPNTIQTTNKFFKKHKANPLEAKRVYERDVKPSIMSEAVELNKKLEKLDSILNKIDDKRITERKKVIENSIVIDDDLLALTHKAKLPIVAFPDFYQLEFDDIERKVAAQRIVSGSLMNLVSAKESAANTNDKQKLDNKINQVKYFVRSLASNTPESVKRRDRITEKEKSDDLYLENNSVAVGNIDNILAITDRYIDSYDNTLPINHK